MSLSLFLLLHQPPSLPFALLRVRCRAESTAHRSRKTMGGWLVTTGQHPMGASGFAKGRSGEQAASTTRLPAEQSQCRNTKNCLASLQLDLGRGPCSAQCSEGFLPSGPGRGECIPGLLCCAASKRKEDLLPSWQLGAGQRQEPAFPRWTRTEGAMAVGQD